MKNGKLQHSALKSAAMKFDVNCSTIVFIWERGQASYKTGADVADVLRRQKRRFGRKKFLLT